MNNDEFLQEVKNSSLCPPDFEAIYNEFCYYQGLAVDTLKEIDRICKKNKLPYQLAYGSLLGAVRDGGQIPWDYDVDIFIPYSMKERFIDALNNDLSTKFYYYCPEINSTCRHFFIRVAPKGYKSEALHIDVFYIVGAPDDEEERKQFALRLLELNTIRFNKLVKPGEEAVGNRLWQLKLLKAKIKSAKYNLRDISAEYHDLCSRYSVVDSKYIVSADSFGWKRSFTNKEINETMRCSTSNGEYVISANYDSILKKMFGDYLTIPPLEKRLKEMMSSYNKLTFFSRKENQ